MGRRTKPTVKDYGEYLVLRTVQGVVCMCPWAVGRRLAGYLGHAARFLDLRFRYPRMVRDIRRAFPHFTPRQVHQVAMAAYRLLFESAVDTLNFMRFGAKGLELVEVQGLDKLQDAQGKSGIIFVTGHFGCWELLGLVSTAFGYPVASIARPRNNPLTDRYLQKLREATGQRMLEKRGSMRQALHTLKSGGNLAFLIDQDARRNGIFVEFLGRPAATVTSVARLSVGTGAPVAFIYARRPGPQERFEVIIKSVIWPRPGADKQEEIRRITESFTRDIEELVRQWPAEWLWLHNRWKTYPGKYPGRPQPEGQAAEPAGEP